MRYCYLPICLAAGLLFSTSLKALDLGFVDFGGAVTLDSTSGEMDYLFIDFSGESFQVVETTGAVSPVTPMPVFGDTNDVPFGWEITRVDFSITTDSLIGSGSSDAFEIYLSTGGNTLELGPFAAPLQTGQLIPYTAESISLVNANADENLYFAIKWTGTDSVRITGASLSIEVSPVPEPAQFAITFGLLVLVTAVLRRRR
ncbi:hypothetical protein [Coraliomargarita akajimensis]|uniref:PEP-CTERM protein-sorting domain-containing protein n=1 Tax=Coraliomargarita akajimensis (strain DSM 45221 / IAM 15411 / JCM 23193 / KCTC 12865 / 04OKA010-24) TaxID=583355 RepID=D5EL00_CORAD|nr:hypothetical protein [Coraliomargarita akajimensis]ADE53102.1 hypothetical protein Caka_0073 [Coraliomargarita akajimensis DSM 45221]